VGSVDRTRPEPYSAPLCHGPVMAQVMPLPGTVDPLPWMLTNITSPSGEKVAPANSLSLNTLTANSKASQANLR
jgi:hypothetical protein